MRFLVVSAFLAVVSCSTTTVSIDVRLSLVVAAARARFSSRLPPTQSSVSLGREVTAQLPLISISDSFLNIREAEEVCTALLGELSYISHHRNKQNAQHLEPFLLQSHNRMMAGLTAYEAALQEAQAKATAAQKEGLRDGIAIVQKSRVALCDIKRLLKGNYLGQIVNDRVHIIRSHSTKFLAAETGVEDILYPANESVNSIVKTIVKTLAAMRKLMLYEFEAEMRYMRVKLKPRVNVKAQEGVEVNTMSLLEPTLDYGMAYSGAFILVRRLNVVIQVVNALLSMLSTKVGNLLPADHSVHTLIELIKLRISEQRTSVLALTSAVPAEFPLTRSEKQALDDSAEIRHFISRCVAIAEAEEVLASNI